MSKRTQDWNESLAKDLKSKRFAQQFILSAQDEGLALQEILRKVIHAHGVKEFADKIDMAPANLSRVLNPRANPTQATLNRLLKPFGLKLTVTTISGKLAA